MQQTVGVEDPELYKFRTSAMEETEMKALVVHEVLPVEVMQHVLGMLDVPDLIRAEVVCSAWCRLAEPAWLWERVFRERFSLSAPAPADGLPPFFPYFLLYYH
jgi:hypothetical protein